MGKTYAVVVGTVLLLIGVLGWIFRSGFGDIPVYLLIVNIVAGLWGVIVGFSSGNKPAGPTTPSSEQP